MKKKILIFLLLIILATATIIQAASFTFTAKASKTTVKPGDEITVTFDISNIDLGEEGTATVEGKINYDKEVFEEVKQSSITSSGSWVVTYNDENTDLNGKFLAMNMSGGTTEAQSIATVKFKIKDNVTKKETQIIIEDIASNDGTNLIEEADKTINITIEQPNNDEENNNNQMNNNLLNNNLVNNNLVNNNLVNNNQVNNNQVNNNNQGNSKVNNSANKTKNDTTQQDKNLPQAGTNEAIILISLITVSLIGIVSYIAYRKMKY